MEYNSTKEILVIPEYGRHIHKMIKYVTSIEDKTKRQELAEGVVELMLQMNPAEKHSKEYVSKMWSHMFKISNYELDVDLPKDVDVVTDEAPDLRGKVDYPKGIPNYRHYGAYIQELIKKALEMPEGQERQDFVRIIGSYMKTAYKQWNRDHYINDESVLEDINIMTKGELSISDDQSLDYLKSSYNNSNNNRKKSKNYSSNKRRGRPSNSRKKPRGKY